VFVMAWELKVLCVIALYMVTGCLWRSSLACWVRGGHTRILMYTRWDRDLVRRCTWCAHDVIVRTNDDMRPSLEPGS